MADKPPATTTDGGAPVASDEYSLTVGPDGPIVLQDQYLIEQMANFNRERIAERQPHAKGSGAYGVFETTEDVSRYTSAALFQPGVSTEMLARFSTVAGESGSPDTWRDPRGFALKFYTSEGNYDMVGNNTPIFFVRDPMKFQHFIRSQKRRADNGLRDHDMQWDFWTLSPESAHMVTWLMGDRGIPKTYRHMNGYSSHTYMWVNSSGERHWVKYHFKTDQGIDFLTQEEADRMAGENPDYHRQDLFEAIRDGDFPSWTLHVQIMPFEDAKSYRFNPFDLTKVWPHGDYPLIRVGQMTLNRNVTDFHTEIEQAAFEPNNLVRGIGLSPDKMLLARGFSYSDAHRARLGVNYKQLPVNSPHVEVRAYSKDGAMRTVPVTDPVYAPNSYGGPAADPSLTDTAGLWASDGEMVRAAYSARRDDDDFSQAGTQVREVLDDAARAGSSPTSPDTCRMGSPRRCSPGLSNTGSGSIRTSASGCRAPSQARSGAPADDRIRLHDDVRAVRAQAAGCDVVAAERAGFDFSVISDHFQPWLESQGHAPYAWSVLGAAAQATERIGLMTYVTCPMIRYHPAIVAQKAATTQILSDGRFRLGLGAGENLNEHVVGKGWPSVGVRHEMLSEAVDIIRALLAGRRRVNYRGNHFDSSQPSSGTPPTSVPVGIAVSGQTRAGSPARRPT